MAFKLRYAKSQRNSFTSEPSVGFTGESSLQAFKSHRSGPRLSIFYCMRVEDLLNGVAASPSHAVSARRISSLIISRYHKVAYSRFRLEVGRKSSTEAAVNDLIGIEIITDIC